jgi:hypothetical protein
MYDPDTCMVKGCKEWAMGTRPVPFMDENGVHTEYMDLCKKHYFGPDNPYDEEK